METADTDSECGLMMTTPIGKGSIEADSIGQQHVSIDIIGDKDGRAAADGTDRDKSKHYDTKGEFEEIEDAGSINFPVAVDVVDIQSFHRLGDEDLQISRSMIPIVVRGDQDQVDAVDSERLRVYFNHPDRKIDALSGVKYMFYSTQSGLLEARSLNGLAPDLPSLEKLLNTFGFWLDIFNPSETDMTILAQIFNIHPLSKEDIETDSTREKCETFKSYIFICYCSLDQNPDSPTFMQSSNVYLLVYRKFVLSFHYCPFASLRKITRRLDALKSYLELTPQWINYASVELEVESIDELVFVISSSEQSDMLRRIANARKRVTTLQKLLVAKADVLRNVTKRLEASANSETEARKISNIRDIILYLSDVQDHVITMDQSLTHVDSTLNRSHANYLAQINIEITQSSNKANDSMTKLTAVASVLVPLNVITGLWGMNVSVPGMAGTVEDPNHIWFIGIIVVMMTISTIAYIFFRQSGLLGKL